MDFHLSLAHHWRKGERKKGRKPIRIREFIIPAKWWVQKWKVASKALVNHRNDGKTTFVIPHQENRQTSITNPRTPKFDFIKQTKNTSFYMDITKNKTLALPQAKSACPHLGHPRIRVGGSISKPTTSPILNPNLVHPNILNQIPVFLSKLKNLKINYDKFVGKIIKMSYV